MAMTNRIVSTLCTSITLIFVSASIAQAGSFCTKLEEIAKYPSAHTQTITPSVLFPESFSKPAIAASEAACKISATSQYMLTCTWQFSYRAAEATSTFDTLRGLAQSCADDPAGFTKDQNVNHPDYYEAYYFGFNENTLSVSIKDKGALQKTYVVLRMK